MKTQVMDSPGKACDCRLVRWPDGSHDLLTINEFEVIQAFGELEDADKARITKAARAMLAGSPHPTAAEVERMGGAAVRAWVDALREPAPQTVEETSHG